MSEDQWLDGFTVVGEIQRPFGVRGEARVKPETFDLKRFSKIKESYLANPNTKTMQKIKIESSRVRGETLLVQFENFNTPEIVAEHRFFLILIPETERLPLAEGEYYLSDLIDLDVLDCSQNKRGKVIDIEEYPANFVFTLSIDGKQHLAPWIEDCILEINTSSGFILVDTDFLGI